MNQQKAKKWAKKISSDKNQQSWENGSLGKELDHAKKAGT